MSELVANHETQAEMERRHKAEVRQLEGEIRAMLKAAKKSTKAQVETEALRKQYELKARHKEEEEELEAITGDSADGGGAADEDSEKGNDEAAKQAEREEEAKKKKDEEEQQVMAKKAKAKRKQDKKKAKEVEKEVERQQIAQSAGPSLRDIELDEINRQLLIEELEVKPVISDGNCLYRAIADQLQFASSAAGGDQKKQKKQSREKPLPDYNELRGIAAGYIRSHGDEFSPFLGMSPEDPEFEEYVEKVASTSLSEWGGQLEVKAIAAALNVTILIYAANAPVVTMTAGGDDDSSSSSSRSSSSSSSSDSSTSTSHPLRITFHRHYYALGEHYNSVTYAGGGGDGTCNCGSDKVPTTITTTTVTAATAEMGKLSLS